MSGQSMGKSLGKIDTENMSISPSYRRSDWVAAVERDDWGVMVAIFKDRIEGRFLKPVRLIAEDKSIGEFSGFVILAIDCLLIETLNQFYLGINETTGRNHDQAFWNVFKSSDFFKDFSKKSASVFYGHFRCGILHQAQTKNKSLVRIEQKRMVEMISNKFDDGLVIDREKFHHALESEIQSYMNKLKLGDDATKKLRSNFKIKMNIICGSPET